MIQNLEFITILFREEVMRLRKSIYVRIKAENIKMLQKHSSSSRILINISAKLKVKLTDTNGKVAYNYSTNYVGAQEQIILVLAIILYKKKEISFKYRSIIL